MVFTLGESGLCCITVCRFAMGGIFTTNARAEQETTPIANVLLTAGIFSL